MWAEIMNITSVHYIPESMSTYRITEESATRSKNIEKVFRLRVSAAEIMIYLCNKYNLPSDIRSRFEGDTGIRIYWIWLSTIKIWNWPRS
jgi:hypothetical protein